MNSWRSCLRQGTFCEWCIWGRVGRLIYTFLFRYLKDLFVRSLVYLPFTPLNFLIFFALQRGHFSLPIVVGLYIASALIAPNKCSTKGERPFGCLMSVSDGVSHCFIACVVEMRYQLLWLQVQKLFVCSPIILKLAKLRLSHFGCHGGKMGLNCCFGGSRCRGL